ncbi:MAG: CatA-like O-acetyltransferase [Saprospiraceae bacterium]
MKTLLDLDTWNRKEHYHFFSRMDEPFFGIVVDVDVTKAYAKAKELGITFFQYYLYLALKAANQIENFRYRIENEQVYCYDAVHVSATIGRQDGTFGFSFIEYDAALPDFIKNMNAEIEAVQSTPGLRFNDNAKRIDTIHFSALPWLHFTGLTHARSFTYRDSAPKISVGKFVKQNDQLLMPVAIYVHHGLADAYHVGQMVELYQMLLKE